MNQSQNEIIEAFETRKRELAADPQYDQDPPGLSQVASDWALKDSWTVSEAANLLCRCHPNRPWGLPDHGVLDDQVHTMRIALHRSGLAGESLNGDMSLMDAQAVCRWARGKGIPLPEPLTRQFLADTEQAPTAKGSTSEHGNTIRYLEEQKAILEAALAVVGRFHHQCVDTKRQVKAQQVARLIHAKQATLFEPGMAPQSPDQMARHIRSGLSRGNAAD